MRSIGLHLRLYESLQAAVERAIALGLPVFQCFFIEQHSRKFITVTRELMDQCATWRSKFDAMFVHGSYYINLASKKHNAARLLQRELSMARRLSGTHLILHPGSAVKSKEEGIDTLVRSLNMVMKKERDVTIVLENTAHAKLAIGSDITDLKLIQEKLDYPELVQFCIDTAHAHSFGYDIINPQTRDQFIQLIDDAIGITNVAVIHLNDTSQHCGSCIDKHERIGHGKIGQDALREFVLDHRIAHIPLILELPVLSELEENAMLQKIRGWHTVQ